MSKKFNNNIIEVITILHNNGKTPVEISKILNVTANGIRFFLKRNSFIPNIKPKNDRSRECVICKSSFVPPLSDGLKKNRYKTCSKICLKKLFTSNKIKYTQNQIDEVVRLKKENISNKLICEQTGVNINKVKEIIRENGLYLSPEQAQKNAQIGRNVIGKSIFSYEDRNKTIELIEKDILENKGTAYGLSVKYGLNPNSVIGTLNNRGKKHLLNINTSTPQKSLHEFIKNYLQNTEILYNDRKVISPKELDIYIPSSKIGIEYNGLYWHTENKVGKNAHYEKMKQANSEGIRLITIFEHEWENRQSQVKNFLKSALGVSSRTFAGRKTTVKSVENVVGKEFMNNHHIQGATHTSLIYLGIFNNEELLGVLSLGRHHRGTDGFTIVLDRLCFLDDVTVQGGASKLLKYSIQWAKQNGYKKMISWSDNRWSEGNVYQKMGFALEEELKPDYFYVKNGEVFSKQSLKKKGEEKIGLKTEKELRSEQGYERVYDCGKKRWVIDLS